MTGIRKSLGRRPARAYGLRAGTLLILGTLLQACAWFGDETPRARMIDIPEMENTLADARRSLPTSTTWPHQAWWESFGDPRLNRLIETALSDNPDLKAASSRLRQAQALVDVRAAELYPTLDASVSFRAQRFSANSTQAKLAGEHFRHLLINPLILRYHLDFWGRDKAALEAAVGTALAADAEVADARLLLAATVARGYFDLAAAIEKLKHAERIVQHRRVLLELAETQLETGLVSTAPLLDVQVGLNRALQRKAAAEAEAELMRDLLAALAGRGPDWGHSIEIGESVFPGRLPLPENLPLHLLAHRPDIAAAKLRVEAAAQEIKVARTAFYPDVNLVAFAGLHSVSITDVILQGSSLAYAVGPSIEFPIFEGGRLRANLSHQEAAYDTAVETYNAGLLGAVREVADALARWREIDSRLDAQRRTIAAVVETGRLAESLYRHGLGHRGEVAEARATEHEQRFLQAALESAYFRSAVDLIQALGGGYASTNTP